MTASITHLGLFFLFLERLLFSSAGHDLSVQLNLASLLAVNGQVAHASLVLARLSFLGILAFDEIGGFQVGRELVAWHCFFIYLIINWRVESAI